MKERFKQQFTKQQKLQWQCLKRAIKDRFCGYTSRMVLSQRITPADLSVQFPYSLSTKQRITNSSSLPQKLVNLRLAAQKISGICIPPKAIFSFWKCVGEPTSENGFTDSRSIVQGTLQNETGGGLCQLSGILHYLLLEAGFKASERHSHSVDIYAEGERFAPIGTDATVVYGYKDFRFINVLSSPILFSFIITETTLQASLHSLLPLERQRLRYERTEKPPNRIVNVYRNEKRILTSSYQIA